MQNLIDISEVSINNSKVNSVSARDLYLGLGLASDQWSRWSKKNIEENKFFTQGIDFIRNDTMSNPTNGIVIKDFIVTIDFAKHLAMMAKTEKAHEYRNYFIECEKKSITKPEPIVSMIPSTTAKTMIADFMDVAELFGVPKHNAQIESCKFAYKATGIDYSVLLLSAPEQDNITKSDMMLEPTPLGKLLGYSAREMNQVLARLGLQSKVGDMWQPTHAGEKLSFVHAWNEHGKSGYNLKWNVEAVKAMLHK